MLSLRLTWQVNCAWSWPWLGASPWAKTTLAGWLKLEQAWANGGPRGTQENTCWASNTREDSEALWLANGFPSHMVYVPFKQLQVFVCLFVCLFVCFYYLPGLGSLPWGPPSAVSPFTIGCYVRYGVSWILCLHLYNPFLCGFSVCSNYSFSPKFSSRWIALYVSIVSVNP